MTVSLLRHPELVSGSISRTAPWVLKKHNRDAGLENGTSAFSARWTLKRVQGDGVYVSGASA